jgi:protein disulfide-isomerase-like protein|tara:strand:+ start:5413 stop:6162 length:750 start_codon:yes stop_codon:yes gene_type:complete
MRSSRVAAVALLVLFAVTYTTAQGEVVTLTDDTFEHQTQASSGQTTGVWFVKFYAPWCGHCRAMAPTWSELAAQVDGTGVIIADVDATHNPVTTDRFNGLIKGFPTLLLFRNGGMFKYAAPRDLESLLKFATETYAEAQKHDVPEPPSTFTKYFSVATRALAVFIIDAHGAFAAAGMTATKDFGNVVSGWRDGGFGGLINSAKTSAANSPKMYGAVLLLFSVVGICFAILLALITAPTRKDVPSEKKND